MRVYRHRQINNNLQFDTLWFVRQKQPIFQNQSIQAHHTLQMWKLTKINLFKTTIPCQYKIMPVSNFKTTTSYQVEIIQNLAFKETTSSQRISYSKPHPPIVENTENSQVMTTTSSLDGIFQKSILSRLPHPPKVEIVQNHCFQDHQILQKWKLSKISLYTKPPHAPKMEIVNKEASKALHSAAICICTIHLEITFTLCQQWPLMYPFFGRHISFSTCVPIPKTNPHEVFRDSHKYFTYVSCICYFTCVISQVFLVWQSFSFFHSSLFCKYLWRFSCNS